MQSRRLNLFVRRCRSWLPDTARHGKGQVALYMAVILMALMGLAGSGVDYGLIVFESARLQHALDAASLAGARALVTSTGSSQTARNSDGETAATTYLGLQGYVTATNGATFTFAESASDTATGAINDTMQVNAVLVKPTSFWKVVGINSTTLNRSATAVASGGMVDVMLSLDLTGSMERSGTDDLGQLRDAVVEFINQMQVDPTNPRGTQVGIARWAGIKCKWDRGYTGASTSHGDGDLYVDQDRGPNGSEYITPCDDDKTVIQPLTNNKNQLLKVARNDGATTCPTSATSYGCPLVSWKYQKVPVTYGTPTASGTPVSAAGLQDNGTTKLPNATASCSSGSEWCMATGTKIANGLTVAKEGSYCAWSTANGGRNDPATTGVARKVLVMMTDGKNESAQLGIPTNYTPDLSDWDQTARDAAAAIKLGCDGTAGTVDDVEVFVVGFFCTPYNSGSAWCLSRIADTTTTHKCPGTTWPTSSPAPSTIDTLLRDVSSSSSGTCDHYFPIKKTEDLPQLFRVMAGSIARGRLQ